MRIFVNIPTGTGSRQTIRLNIINCTDTTEFIKQTNA